MEKQLCSHRLKQAIEKQTHKSLELRRGCWNPAEKSSNLCLKHRAQRRDHAARQLKRRLEKGLCRRCSRLPVPGKTYCEFHSYKRKIKYKKNSNLKKEKGLCAAGSCTNLAPVGFSKCESCRIKNREAINKKLKDKSRGICKIPTCGGIIWLIKFSLCWRCYNRQREGLLPINEPKLKKICIEKDCGQIVDSLNRCKLHYRRFRDGSKPFRPAGICSVLDCGKKNAAWGFCNKHYKYVKGNTAVKLRGDDRRNTVEYTNKCLEKLIYKLPEEIAQREAEANDKLLEKFFNKDTLLLALEKQKYKEEVINPKNEINNLCESIPALKFLKNMYKVASFDDKEHNRKVCTLIEWLDILYDKECYVCGDRVNVTADRIDNSRGHEVDNILPCGRVCNVFRNDLYTPEEMKQFIGPAMREFNKYKNNPYQIDWEPKYLLSGIKYKSRQAISGYASMVRRDKKKEQLSCTRQEFRNFRSYRCVYCGNPNNVRLDRIDNTKGHTVENSVPACKYCNVSRNDNFTAKEFGYFFGSAIKKILEKRNIYEPVGNSGIRGIFKLSPLSFPDDPGPYEEFDDKLPTVLGVTYGYDLPL